MLKSEERQALPESVELPLSDLSVEEIAALEGTAHGSVIKEINDRPTDQPTAAGEILRLAAFSTDLLRQ